jgi:hypothetical protein
MRTKVSTPFPEVTLGRILQALEHELMEASDGEILEAAADLGMDPAMKGSAAFLGLKSPAVPRLQDFFSMAGSPDARLAVERLLGERLARASGKAPELGAPARPPRTPRLRKRGK